MSIIFVIWSAGIMVYALGLCVGLGCWRLRVWILSWWPKRHCFLGVRIRVLVLGGRFGKRGLWVPPRQYGLAVPVSIDSVDPVTGFVWGIQIRDRIWGLVSEWWGGVWDPFWTSFSGRECDMGWLSLCSFERNGLNGVPAIVTHLIRTRVTPVIPIFPIFAILYNLQ